MNKGMMCCVGGGGSKSPLGAKCHLGASQCKTLGNGTPKKEITSLIGIIQPTTLTFFREEVKSRVSIFSPFQHCVDEYSGHAP